MRVGRALYGCIVGGAGTKSVNDHGRVVKMFLDELLKPLERDKVDALLAAPTMTFYFRPRNMFCYVAHQLHLGFQVSGIRSWIIHKIIFQNQSANIVALHHPRDKAF